MKDHDRIDEMQYVVGGLVKAVQHLTSVVESLAEGTPHAAEAAEARTVLAVAVALSEQTRLDAEQRWEQESVDARRGLT